MIGPAIAWEQARRLRSHGAGQRGGGSGNSTPTTGSPGDRHSLASRSGRGVTTANVPTRKARSAGVGNCRGGCCPNCSGETPIYWTLAIPGAYETFRLEKWTIAGGGTFGCAWRWTGSSFAFACSGYAVTSITMIIFGHGPIQITMAGPDGLLGFFVLNGISPSINCASSRTLEFFPGALGCADQGDATITPSAEVFDPCCGECGHRPGSGSGLQSCGNGCCTLKDSTDMYDLDFGGTGFLSENYGYDGTIGAPFPLDRDVLICAECPDVGNVYTVTRIADCTWRYTEDACEHDVWLYFRGGGQTAGRCATGDPGRLKVDLQRRKDADGCYWQANAGIQYACPGSSEQPNGELWANYRSASEPAETTCYLGTPITLTKISENEASEGRNEAGDNGETTPPTACLGEWPDTITLASVA